MSDLKLIPVEMLQIVPYYNGDRRLLSFFLRKCEYVYERYKGDDDQNEYVMHAITSRLTENAAAIVSDRDDLSTMEKLKQFLILHFGDYRNEDFTAAELEHLRINTGESYSDFCNRIRSALYVLLSKVNLIEDEKMRQCKIDIYKKMAINVFLYNLPMDIVRIVRLRGPGTIEEALGIVLEETNFYNHYNMYKSAPIKYGINASSNPYSSHGFKQPPSQGFTFGAPQSTQGSVGFGAAQGNVNSLFGNSQPQSGALFGTAKAGPSMPLASQQPGPEKLETIQPTNFSINK
ncbi:uncharacterized protein LOC113520986 [Galleria mellonella]|uniref:Uncharacterized protein LOC113520986 n=1 Tax=Galleria mellonella TaxID=7137 RepID=A0ABM3MA45_GALME|nr:uncharacterized protein LOC113520986 [Galleria mellonella]